jgi:ABC-type glycerol-3-phosphate transport system substrate-binding protein
MVLGFSQDIKRLKTKNPHLKYGVLPIPQRKDSVTSATYGSFFFPAVSRLSKSPAAAWQFAYFLTMGPGADLYTKKTGRPPARRDLIATGAESATMDVFYKQSLIAKSWAVPNYPATKKLFDEAVDAILLGAERSGSALSKLESQIELLYP